MGRYLHVASSCWIHVVLTIIDFSFYSYVFRVLFSRKKTVVAIFLRPVSAIDELGDPHDVFSGSRAAD
ncbi:MAG TPA: hypothetical protein DDW52_27545 [Planctomycetaceae bacterium]|nr:hypothetical protein [Planctomycetaceae bacterium]